MFFTLVKVCVSSVCVPKSTPSVSVFAKIPNTVFDKKYTLPLKLPKKLFL